VAQMCWALTSDGYRVVEDQAPVVRKKKSNRPAKTGALYGLVCTACSIVPLVQCSTTVMLSGYRLGYVIHRNVHHSLHGDVVNRF
jgi:hypothetical protein